MKGKLFASWVCLLVFLVSCEQKTDIIIPTPAEKTVLVYLAADNNIGRYVQSDLDEIMRGVEENPLSVSQHLVIYDDINLEPGQLRIREKGSAGGHNGIKNIIAHLGTQVFPRIRVGVGEKPARYDLADYVLGHFSKAEQELMSEGYDHAVCAAGMIVSGRIGDAMSEFNRKKKTEV